MTQRQLKYFWIDDDSNKVQSYLAAIQNTGVLLTPIIVEVNLLDVLTDLTLPRNSKPDLVIIDQVFSQVKLPLKLKGSSVAHLLRGAWPNIPMVCVSAALVDPPKKFDQEDISEYTAVFKYSDLAQNLVVLKAIAEDFPKIPTLNTRMRNHIVNLLRVPDSEKATFLRILPAEFGNKLHVTTQHRIARWIFNVLMARPGFLYNKLRAATFMGLNIGGFDKVQQIFEPALYKGPFSNTLTPLWWVSDLERLLLQTAAENGPDSTQQIGRLLPGIEASDFSKCYVDEAPEHIPDVVVRLDSTNAEKPVCARHTKIDPNDVATPGFESLLILSSDR